MDVNQTIVKVLEEIGVDYVFGGSGQVNASMLLALNKSEKIKTVIIQNEQAASFMAAGYAMFSKKLGVCFATGGPGANLDMANCWELHQLIMRAYKTGKIVAALCYAVSTLVFLRDPENDYKSIIYGKKITAHPRAWDFYGPGMAMTYEVYGGDKDLATDVVTPGFQWPIEDLVRDAVGPNGACIARINTTRENPQVYYDHPFITGTSVESSIAYGDKIVEVLKKLGK